MPYTMFISAFWHGIHPGYFLSFLTIPLCTAAEDVMFRRFPEDDETKKRNPIFQQIWIFIRCRGFEMLATGFLLLTWEDTTRLWSGFFWWLQVFTVAIIAFDLVLPKKKVRDADESTKKTR
uniref:Lysophospholipid acyltransferase 7 n=1 Tax=Steinernema glaseri TaxID=37863 RepID=A0A1I7YS16_9BILA